MCPGMKSEVYKFVCGFGTHIDSPAHFNPEEGFYRVHSLPLGMLVCPGVVIDISERAAENPDTELYIKDIEEWEEKFGMIPEGAFVVMRSGWDLKVNDEVAYMNRSEELGRCRFPGYSVDAALFLHEKRKVAGIGTDGICIDSGIRFLKNEDVHKLLLKHNMFFMELMYLVDVPKRPCTMIVAPVNVRDAPETPTRILAIS